MYEKLLVLESVSVDFNTRSMLTLNIAIGLIMVGVALNIKLQNFSVLFKNPRPFIIGVLSQFVALPLITFILIISLPLPASVALGMLLVACVPGGNVSNFMSSYSKSNVELSVSLTIFATLVSWIITPLNFALYGSWFLKISARKHEIMTSVEIDFFQMLQTIVLIMVIPLVIGLFIAKKFPGFAEKVGPTVRRISMLVFAVIVIIAISRNSENLFDYLHLIFLLVLLHSSLSYGVGYIMGRSFKLSRINVRTVTLETGIQNAALALALIFNPKLFNGAGGMATIAAWWGVWTILSGMLVAMFFSYRKLQN